MKDDNNIEDLFKKSIKEILTPENIKSLVEQSVKEYFGVDLQQKVQNIVKDYLKEQYAKTGVKKDE